MSIGAGTAAIIPYRHALWLLWQRLRWDLRPISWRSRGQLRAWRDRHAGERAVILGNGPSLLASDLDLLEGVFTFGLNKVNLLFDQTRFRPSCIVAVNPLVIAQNRAFYNATAIPLFLDGWEGIKHVPPRAGVVYLHSTAVRRFARDCGWSVHQGGTVTFVALQLAFHMGFQEVALIGCDHRFATTGPGHGVVVAGPRDLDHFHPGYFSPGQPWQLPDLVENEIAYLMARAAYQAAGRQLVNATSGGALELLPRQSLSDFLGGRPPHDTNGA